MNSITVSAPGKLMLFGEHAVVYNHPCLVTAVAQRMKARVELLDKKVFQLEAHDVQVQGYRKPLKQLGKGAISKGTKFVEVAVKNFVEKYALKNGVNVETKSEFSSQFGFGSSSAIVVCTIKALSQLFNVSMTKKELFDLSFKTVLDIQGKGSGFDIAAAIYGGTIYFWTGGKKIESIDVNSLPLIIGYTGIKADTISIINMVAELARKYPEQVEVIYAQIEKLVARAKEALLQKDWQTVGELMNINQGYLETLGVGSKKLADMIYAAREAGAYGAKLSGAGGGDCMIVIGPNDKKEQIERAVEKAGGKVLKVGLGAEGVRIE